MKTVHILLCLTFLSFLGLGCGRKTGTVTDRDGNVYRTVKIGDQWWMAENLRTTRYRSGTPIPNVTDRSQWARLRTGAYCYYGNNSGNAATYGALYNWQAVNGDTDGDGRKNEELAPKGWHVATYAEWEALTDYLGGASIAGEKLKSTSGWDSDGNGTDEVGFAALPSGYRNLNNGNFFNMGYDAYFWSASECNTTSAWQRVLNYNNATVYRNTNNKRNGFSVRCVKDYTP